MIPINPTRRQLYHRARRLVLQSLRKEGQRIADIPASKLDTATLELMTKMEDEEWILT